MNTQERLFGATAQPTTPKKVGTSIYVFMLNNFVLSSTVSCTAIVVPHLAMHIGL